MQLTVPLRAMLCAYVAVGDTQLDTENFHVISELCECV